MVRVAVIDSGVHAIHPHVHGVCGGAGFTDAGLTHADFVDRLGHGTAVTAVVCEKAPAAHILVAKIFDRDLRTSGIALATALRWAVAERVDLINLSLGTINREHATRLQHCVDDACAANILVVSAAPQPGSRWLPGALPGVLAVDLDWAMSRDTCEISVSREGMRRARASGYPRPIPGVSPERNLKGISFAVANVTGLLARAWPNLPPALARRRDKLPSMSSR